MTDQMDRRLQEMVNQLAAAAPDAPPFPATTTRAPAAGRRMPGWALATAGAAAVLLIIGVPFLLFGGGKIEDPVTSSPTTVAATVPPTTIPTPPSTIPVPEGLPACIPAGLLVRPLAADGTAGHLVTPVRFTNVSGDPCALDDPLSVTGIGSAGQEVAAAMGTNAVIATDAGPVLAAGQSRVMLLEVGTACEGGRLIGPEASSVRVELPAGNVSLEFSGDLGCQFGYSPFGEWLEADPITPAEEATAVAVIVFAQNPDPDNFAVIPFTDTVTLTLGPKAGRQQPSASLALAGDWVFGTEYDGFRARTAPYSALEMLAQPRPVEVTAGPRDHCASPPMPVHEDLIGLRQISIQPVDATSCLEWWAVDLFLTPEGEVAGITLDLWEP
ncbi:MAG: hypothetical protein ACR2OI_03725 [Acidimicrobiia bacterium]